MSSFMQSDPTKPFILVDGSSYLYRAFHALPALANSKGFPTGAIYGMINMLKRLIADYQSEYMTVIFDTKGKTFRDEIYPEYKATRKEMPPELVQQIEPLHQIIRALGIPILMIEGIEADDIIGSLATLIEKHAPVLISTGDKDLAQLVTDRIHLINTMTDTLLDTDGVKKKFGVMPEQIIDYLMLVGDTSDNIPGVPQVGPKTAVKWLEQYHTVDQLIAAADQISGKIGEKLRAAIPQFALTRSLVTIKKDLDLGINLHDLKIQAADNQQLIHLFKEMEFKNWLAALLDTDKDAQKTQYEHYTIITTPDALAAWITKLKQHPLFAFDTETTDLDYMKARIVGLSFAIEPGYAVYIPLAHDYEDAPSQLNKEQVLMALKPILENPQIKKIGQNSKYDMEVLANEKIQLQGIAYDTLLESYVLDSASNSHNMDALALKYLGWKTITYAEVAGSGAKQLPFNKVDIQKAGIYAAEDADVTLQLHHTLWPRIEKEKGIHAIFTDVEMPLIPVLARMEQCGVLIDPDQLKTQGTALQKRLTELEKEIIGLTGVTFNINSPKQLQEILYKKMNLPILQKTPTGQPSTADAILQELAIDFALPRLIIEYRSISKLISTYTNRLATQINPETGRIHTSYNQTGTATGRLSSSEPNLQNIPIRTPEGRRIRQAFIADKGYQLISADYSQIELRIMAHISQDPNLLHAFKHNLDIHKATAAEVWNVSIDDVTHEMRRNAKAINFGLIYGMSAFGLTKQLGIDRHAAQQYIDNYFARYPNVKAYMDNTRLHAKEKGYVETLWGRRLYLPDIHATQLPRQRAAERAAINAPLQGSAADIIKLAMIRIDHWLREQHIPARMIMQVHDELVFEADKKCIEEIVPQIREHMAHVVTLDVPLLVSIGIGHNWDEASEHST